MAPTTSTETITKSTKPTKLVCFSFAAYAKTLIHYLNNSLNIPVLPGLTEPEFTYIESLFRFKFPPDLRSILREGLPVGPHFPNWRSSSPQQLQILLNLPSLNLSKNVLKNHFWVESWGLKPDDPVKITQIVRVLLLKAPILIPIYRNCYVPCLPTIAGNPVFYIDDCTVRVLSFDINRFFQEVDFDFLSRVKVKDSEFDVNVPAWAATDARNIEFWTEVAERGRRTVANGWWYGCDGGDGLKACLDDVYWKLRDGRWREEEVNEMLMMYKIDGGDLMRNEFCGSRLTGADVVAHVRECSRVLLDAGWSREDVTESLGVKFQRLNSCSREDDVVADAAKASSFDEPGIC